LNVYRKQTSPLVEYYSARPRYCRVDGAPMVDDVTDAIVAAVNGCRPTV
jgi:adenylate kinase family enzyme